MMKACKCGSYAINHHCHGRDGSDDDLCDVCYWRKRAEQPAQQCKWPTCQSEEYQQALAEQINRELVGEQPAQQEPFTHYRHYDNGLQDWADEKTIPLYTFPPAQRTWVGLTDDEIYSVLENLQIMHHRPPTTDSRVIFARAIEAKLKEENT